MGIEYNAVIVVGLPQDEMDYDEDEYDDLFDFLEDNDMQLYAPFYDGSDADEAVCGLEYVRTGSYQPKEFEWNVNKIDALKEEFKKITGLDAKVWITPEGW